MQKIFSREQMQRCDAHTIANEPVASILLMERAACALFEGAGGYPPVATFGWP